jgi:hypothetical protein
MFNNEGNFVYISTISTSFLKNDWGTLIPRINVENGIKLGFVLE